MSFLKRIQKLPVEKKKIILWAITIISALLLFGLYIFNMKKMIKSFEGEKLKEQFQTEKLEENLKKIEVPKIEIPQPSEEELKQMEEMMKEEETNKQE